LEAWVKIFFTKILKRKAKVKITQLLVLKSFSNKKTKMKTLHKTLIISLLALAAHAQQATEIDTKFVKLPRYADLAAITNVTTGIASPTLGMIVYNIATGTNWYYNGTWVNMLVGGGSLTLPYTASQASASTLFDLTNNGTGSAGNFQTNNGSSTANTLFSTTNGKESSTAIAGQNTGLGKAGNFTINNATSTADALFATTNGTGVAGKFTGTNALETVGNAKVGGNMNLTGEIQNNGAAGTAGQFLRSNGNNTMSWNTIGSTMGYKKGIMILNDQPWTVPAGVTEVMVEIWGGGASAGVNSNKYPTGSGNSGGYGRTVQQVTQSTIINFYIGIGGIAAGSLSQNHGGSSTVTFFSNYLSAYGGIDANYSTSGVSNLDNAIFIHGNLGEHNRSEFSQKNGTVWTQKDFFSIGGTPPGLLYEPKRLLNYSYFENNVLMYTTDYAHSLFPAYGTGNANGGPGFAIIWWN
jgi:hypothetical protein